MNAAMTESIRIQKELHHEVASTSTIKSESESVMTTLDFQPVNEVLLSKASVSSVNGGDRKMFRCNICDELFETEDARAKHSLVHVNRSSSLDCHLCGKQFRHRTNLSTHMIVHSGIKPHQCHICMRRFTQKVNLQRHMHIHDGSRPFTCRMCQKSFTQKANLQRHILSHTEYSKEEVIKALNEIPNESEVNNAINESLSELISVVMPDKKAKLLSATNKSRTDISELKCDLCNKVFTEQIHLQKHLLTHSDARPYQCFVCGQAFRHEETLQKHYSVHTTSSATNFVCQTCNRDFLSTRKLQSHMIEHAASDTNQCYLCEKNFKCEEHLERHFSEHIEEMPPTVPIPKNFFENTTPGQTYRCATCDIIFGSPMIFSQHLKCHQRSLTSEANLLDIGDVTKTYEENQTCPLQCNVCSSVFMSVAKLEEHMTTHASKSKTSESYDIPTEAIVKPSNTIPLTTQHFPADVSNTSSLSSSDTMVTRSIKMEPTSPTSSRPSRCPVCKDMFPSKAEMRTHYSSIHLKVGSVPTPSTVDDEEMEIDEDEDNVFEEEEDDEEEEVKPLNQTEGDQLKSHITESDERMIRENEEFIKDNILGGPAEYEAKGRYERGNYSCKICNRVLTYKYSLEKHMLLHTASYPYKCQLCSKRFNHKANLDKHLVVHSGEKPFVCQICARPFSQKSNLQRHQLTHTQNREFVCDVCGKRFNHMASLKTHSLIHTGAKPFACYVCHKRFNQKGNLKRHIQTHRTGKRNKTRNDSEASDEGIKMESIDETMMHSPSIASDGEESYDEPDVFSSQSSPMRHSGRVRVKKQMKDYEFYDDDEPLPTMIGESSTTSESTTPNASVASYHDVMRDVKEEIVTVMPSDAVDNNNTISHPPQHILPKKPKEAFHCDTCSKLFVSMASLETHKKSAHSSIICETCGKQFSQKANLLKHKLIHLNKKPFVCHVCNKAFRQKANLQRHELIHNKDRKTVNCSECNKSFRCAWSLKQHMKNHALNAATAVANSDIPATTTSIMPGNCLYGCSVCGKTFKEKSQLQVHFAVHQQPPSAFGCGVCNQIYPTKNELLEHMQKHEATHVIAYEGPVNTPIKSN